MRDSQEARQTVFDLNTTYSSIKKKVGWGRNDCSDCNRNMYSQITGNRGVIHKFNAPDISWLVEHFKLLLAPDILRNLSASFAMNRVSIKWSVNHLTGNRELLELLPVTSNKILIDITILTSTVMSPTNSNVSNQYYSLYHLECKWYNLNTCYLRWRGSLDRSFCHCNTLTVACI
jgi:hypothetical protein